MTSNLIWPQNKTIILVHRTISIAEKENKEEMKNIGIGLKYSLAAA